MTSWTNESIINLDKHKAFVYLITNNLTGEKYIGKKNLFSKRTLPPLKGKKRKRIVIKEMKWREYQSSSDIVSKWTDVTKTILIACELVGGATYHETRLLFVNDVLNPDSIYVNRAIGNYRRYYKA